MINVFLFEYLTLQANLVDILRHILKVYCDGWTRQVGYFLGSYLSKLHQVTQLFSFNILAVMTLLKLLAAINFTISQVVIGFLCLKLARQDLVEA